jgi:hypothetical protein
MWFATLASSLELQGEFVVGPYVCPHRFADSCGCKKPNTLLYERAAGDHKLKPADCFVIGDSPEDVCPPSGCERAGILFAPGGRVTLASLKQQRHTPESWMTRSVMLRIGYCTLNDQRRRCDSNINDQSEIPAFADDTRRNGTTHLRDLSSASPAKLETHKRFCFAARSRPERLDRLRER